MHISNYSFPAVSMACDAGDINAGCLKRFPGFSKLLPLLLQYSQSLVKLMVAKPIIPAQPNLFTSYTKFSPISYRMDAPPSLHLPFPLPSSRMCWG